MLTGFIKRFLLRQTQGILGGGPPKEIRQIPRSRSYPDDLLNRPAEIRKAIEKNPRNPDLWIELGYASLNIESIDSAIESFEKALAIDPDRHQAISGLAGGAVAQGQVDKAIALYRRALEIAPADPVTFQNLLFLMLCSGEASDEDIFDWHKRFARQFEVPLLAGTHMEYPNPVDPERILRVGYVSPDFRGHVVGRCIAPVLEKHDRTRFAIHCYYNNDIEDDLTESIRNSCDKWLNIRHLNDEQFCEEVRKDQIDILVDLSGHTPGNRLLAFARKPAPVQVSYLDYSATTGLSSIDYRLTDRLCDPERIADPYYSETLYRLPATYWLYKPSTMYGGNAIKANGDGHIIFACLNSFYRVTDTAIQLWAEILRHLPSAKLVFIGVPVGSTRNALLERFGNLGIGADRIELFGLLTYENYIDLIRATDIALAPFPYNGAMTLLDCLWNGVPVVALEGGKTFRSRMGNSILTTLGLDNLIAKNREDYIGIALKIAGKRRWRNELRMTLRDRIKDSVLYQDSTFTVAMEDAYRQMWRTYCEAYA